MPANPCPRLQPLLPRLLPLRVGARFLHAYGPPIRKMERQHRGGEMQSPSHTVTPELCDLTKEEVRAELLYCLSIHHAEGVVAVKRDLEASGRIGFLHSHHLTGT